jgi:hypothetical protein
VNATSHWLPMVNGYSGFTPREFMDIYRGMRRFPDDWSIDWLRRNRVNRIVVHAAEFEQLKGTRSSRRSRRGRTSSCSPQRATSASTACGRRRSRGEVATRDAGAIAAETGRQSPRRRGERGDFWGKPACHASRRQPAQEVSAFSESPWRLARLAFRARASDAHERSNLGEARCRAGRRQPAQKSSPPSPSLRGDWRGIRRGHASAPEILPGSTRGHAGRRHACQKSSSPSPSLRGDWQRNSPRRQRMTRRFLRGSTRATRPTTACPEVFAFSESPWRLARNSPRSHGALGDFGGSTRATRADDSLPRRVLRLLRVSVAIGEELAAKPRSARRFGGEARVSRGPTTACPEEFSAFSQSPWRLARNSPRRRG